MSIQNLKEGDEIILKDARYMLNDQHGDSTLEEMEEWDTIDEINKHTLKKVTVTHINPCDNSFSINECDIFCFFASDIEVWPSDIDGLEINTDDILAFMGCD